MSTLVEISNASFGYGSGKKIMPIVTNISLTIAEGDFVILLGPNGCGKSTIIRGLFNLVACCEGSITWHIPQSRIGYIPQEPNIDHDIPATALDIVRTSQPSAWRKSKKEAMNMLGLVGMEEFAKNRFGTLSGGQKRRILLARALFGNPKLLVLDEPTVNTDIQTENNMEALLTQLCIKQEVGILATTHSATWARNAKRFQMEGGTIHA